MLLIFVFCKISNTKSFAKQSFPLEAPSLTPTGWRVSVNLYLALYEPNLFLETRTTIPLVWRISKAHFVNTPSWRGGGVVLEVVPFNGQK